MENKQSDSFALTIRFTALEHEAKALYEALLLVSNAWARHKRIGNVNCVLETLSQSDE